MDTKIIIKSLSVAQLIELRKEIEEEILERSKEKIDTVKQSTITNAVNILENAISASEYLSELGKKYFGNTDIKDLIDIIKKNKLKKG